MIEWAIFFVIICVAISCWIVASEKKCQENQIWSSICFNRNYNNTTNTILEFGNTLDIIFTESNSWSHDLVEQFTGSEWSHCGLLFRDSQSGILYVAEMANVEWYNSIDKGNRVTMFFEPFMKWLSFRKGHTFVNECVLWKRSNLNVELYQQKTAKLLYKVRNRKLSQKGEHYLKTLSKKKFCPLIHEHLPMICICSSLVAYVLHQLGLLKKRWSPMSYSPSDLAFSTDFLIPNSYVETRACRFVFDL